MHKKWKIDARVSCCLDSRTWGSMKTSYTSAPGTYTNSHQTRVLSLSMPLMLSVSWQKPPSVKHKVLKIFYKHISRYFINNNMDAWFLHYVRVYWKELPDTHSIFYRIWKWEITCVDRVLWPIIKKQLRSSFITWNGHMTLKICSSWIHSQTKQWRGQTSSIQLQNCSITTSWTIKNL